MINFTDSQSIDRALSHALQNGIEHITNGTVTVAIREFGMVKGIRSVMLSKDRNDAIVGYGTACAMLREWMGPAAAPLVAPPLVAPLVLPAAPVTLSMLPTIKQAHRDIRNAAHKMLYQLKLENRGKWVAYRQVEISYWVGDSMIDEKEFCQWSRFTPSFLRKMVEQCPEGARVGVYVAFDLYDSFADYMSYESCGYDACADGFDYDFIPRVTTGK